jgi:hypothetical protein
VPPVIDSELNAPDAAGLGDAALQEREARLRPILETAPDDHCHR